MNEYRDERPAVKECQYKKGDIVRVAARPKNPCEVLVVALLPGRDAVLFLMDKVTLKGEYRYADDDEVSLVRRPAPNEVAALYKPGGTGVVGDSRKSASGRAMPGDRRDSAGNIQMRPKYGR